MGGLAKVLGLFAVMLTLAAGIYKADTFLTRVEGDKHFATDTEMEESRAEIAAVKQESVYRWLQQEYRDNQKWLWEVERQYGGDTSKMPPNLRDEYYKVKMRQEEIRRQMGGMEPKR